MQAGSITRVEKNVDRAASVLFGVACGYSAYLWLGAGGELKGAVITGLAGALALVTYLLAYRLLSGVKSKARALPVRAFRLHEVEPLDSQDFLEFDSSQRVGLLAAPSAAEPEEFLLTDFLEPEKVPSDGLVEQDELLLTEKVEEQLPVEEPKFDLEEPDEPTELELEEPANDEESVVEEGIAADGEPDEFGPNSRVVRLFDAAAMPTPGQLGSKIDRHLQAEPAQIQNEEAAQALQDALAELRRAIPNRLR